MRQIGAVGSACGVLMLASALASFGDSLLAQTIADHQGPRVSIRAEVTNIADSRRLRAVFDLNDDAYVVVGHIDADGVLRIVFPVDPEDDGFVNGDRSYQSSEFFAGFADEYRVRARDGSLFRDVGASLESYDGGVGYVFVIASWRPMRFDRFTTDGKWDTFELADQQYLRDPRPAIHELASLLAGENREAYTVEFARYYNTISTGAYAARNTSGYCSGYAPFGFASSPFGLFGSGYGAAPGYSAFSRYERTFGYRGEDFYYDALSDCYRPGGFSNYGYGYGGYIIAQAPPTPRVKPRVFDLDGHRSPPTPRPLGTPTMPQNGTDVGAGSSALQTGRFSPGYRRRGLITSDRPNTDPVRGQARVEAQFGAEQRTRPSIQDMINRRGQVGTEGAVAPHLRMQTNDDGFIRQPRSAQPRSAQPRAAPVKRPQI